MRSSARRRPVSWGSMASRSCARRRRGRSSARSAPEHGDLATNSAMVLDEAAREAAARGRRGARRRRSRATRSSRSAEVAGPGFVNLRLHARRSTRSSARSSARALGTAARLPAPASASTSSSSAPTRPGPCTSATRPRRHLRRRRRAPARGDGQPRHARVLRQRLRQPGRGCSPTACSRASEGRDAPEEGYKGRVRRRARALAPETNDPAALDGDRDALARTCVELDAPRAPRVGHVPRHQADPRGPRRRVRRLVQRGVAPPLGARRRRRRASSRRAATSCGRTARCSSSRGTRTRTTRTASSRRATAPTPTSRSDIAYHADKIARGYDRLITSSAPTTTATSRESATPSRRSGSESSALRGAPLPARLHLPRGGEPVKISKRAGNIVTVEEVIDEIDEAAGVARAPGRDALRFFFLSRTRQHERRVRPRSREEEARSTTPSSTSSTATRGSARSSARRRRSGIVPRRPLRRPPGRSSPTPTSSPSRSASPSSPTSCATRRRCASRTRWSSTCRSWRVSSRATSPASRTDPILPQASQREVAGWEASWDFGKTSARLAWIEAIRTVYAAALALLGIAAPRADGPAEGRQRAGRRRGSRRRCRTLKKWRSA